MKRFMCWLFGCRIDDLIDEEWGTIEYCERCRESQLNSWVIRQDKLEPTLYRCRRAWRRLKHLAIGRKCAWCNRRFRHGAGTSWTCSTECGEQLLPF